MIDAKTTDAPMNDAIESALWRDLADALNRLEEWGLEPLHPAREVDAGDVIHGGAVREGGHMLRYQPPFTPDPDRPGNDLPSGWTVVDHPDTTGETDADQG